MRQNVVSMRERGTEIFIEQISFRITIIILSIIFINRSRNYFSALELATVFDIYLTSNDFGLLLLYKGQLRLTKCGCFLSSYATSYTR